MQARLLLILTVIFISSFLQAQSLLRGPYLQVATDTSIHIRWRTDIAENGRVQWGTSAGSLTNSKTEATPVNDHEIILTNLIPYTKYWYSVGSAASVLQGDANNYFMTLPNVGSKGLMRVGVIGDCGNNSVNQMNVRDQMVNYLGSAYMNAWLLLGDNAYLYGSDAEYQAEFFNIYQDKFLKQNPFYPSPGNHDYSDNLTLQNNHLIPYYDNFSMPVNGEAGGIPSYNKAYYSFNIGNVHFLSLDAFGREDNTTRLYDTLGKQVQWIKQDLEANQNKQWTVAFWHHPPFSLGSRNSETDAEMTAIRTNFIRILERYGVDLILCGHSHDYERSKLQKGFYGYEAEFNPALHNLSSSSALYDGSSNSCPYIKDASNAGTVYVVAGSGGQLGVPSAGYPHDAMYYSNSSVGGGMMLEVEDNRLDVKWIAADGIIRDKFTMMKAVNKKENYIINSGDSIVLKASFIGSYSWSPNTATTRTVKVAPSINTTYYVTDAYTCVKDSFVVNINNVILPLSWGSVKGWYEKSENAVHISWKILQEKDVHHFAIERSADGQSFLEIGNVMASANLQDYSFKDARIDNNRMIYYYRIRQVNNNGAVKYSPTINVSLSSRNFDVQVLPNPAHNGEMKIRLLNTSENKTAMLSISDATGKLISTKQLVLNSSQQSFMPDVHAGIYFVAIKTDNLVTTVKVVIE